MKIKTQRVNFSNHKGLRDFYTKCAEFFNVKKGSKEKQHVAIGGNADILVKHLPQVSIYRIPSIPFVPQKIYLRELCVFSKSLYSKRIKRVFNVNSLGVQSALKFSLALILPAVTLFSCKQSAPPEKYQVLVWSDEFDGNALDESKWEVQLGTGGSYGLYLWGNNEQQFYRRENITVENGLLRIRSQREDFQNMEYTSGRMRSLNKADFKYGRMEARIRMDNAPGLWHAFWMLPSNPPIGWPMSGEIDVMEFVGNAPTQILNYIHFADLDDNHRYRGTSYNLLTPHSDFHIYAVEWNENEIRWFVDDVMSFSVTRQDADLVDVWPFDRKFHLLLNTAVGGNLGGNINAQAMTTPRYMEVDYVRVYQ